MAASVTAAQLTRGIGWMVGSSILYALTFATIRELSDKFSVFELSFFRAAIGVLMLTPWLLRAGPGALRTTRARLYLLRAVVSYTGMVCWFFGLANLPLADATALMFTAPFFSVIFLSIWLGETVGRQRWMAVIAGFAGALIVVRPGFAEFSLAMGALLYTAVAYGGSNAATRALAITEDPNRVVFYMFALMVPLSLGPAVAKWTTPGWIDVPLILAFGVLSVLSMVCLTRSLAAAPAAIVMPFVYLQLPLVAVIGFILYGEVPGPTVWVGGGVICAAGYYIARAERRRARAAG